VAVAEQQALLTNNTHANTTSLVRTAVCGVPADSAVSAHPNGVTPVAVAASVVELQAAEAAPLPLPSAADSTKSLAHASLGDSAQPQAEGQQSSGSRDKREKQNSSPSRGPIASDPKAMLPSSPPRTQPAQPQGRNSPPSSSAGAAAASSGVGAGAAAAAFSTSAPSSLSAAFAAAKKVFGQPKASPPSSAAAQHDRMLDDDGSMTSAAPAVVLPTSAQNCLVIDPQRLASFPADLVQLKTFCSAMLSWEERIARVLKWLPALENGGLVEVISETHLARLHLHFKDYVSVVFALKAVPFLVRCCLFHSSSAWGAHKTQCSPLSRCEQPEALHFKLNAAEPLPSGPELTTAIKSFVKNELNIDAQEVFQSSSAVHRQRDIAHGERPQLSFWVLPREADQDALVALIDRVHLKHKLFGGSVTVQGPHSTKTTRCGEC